MFMDFVPSDHGLHRRTPSRSLPLNGPRNITMLRNLILVGALVTGAHLSLFAQQPTLVRDFWPGEVVNGLLNHGRPNTFLVHDNKLHLFANDGPTVAKLYALNDLSGSVTELAQVGAPLLSSTNANFVASGNNLYFMTQVGMNYTLYVVNGGGATALHTAPINVVFGYTLIPMPGGGVIFPGYHAASGYEAWYSDGTESGTHLVKDIMPGTATGLGDPFPLFNGFAFNGKAYFLAYDGATGVQLWSSDGTEAGTSLFATINDPDDSGAIALQWSKNAQRFIVKGHEGMLSSDGTVAGTLVLHTSQYATPRTPGIAHPITDDGVMYFIASENGTPTLFGTDGVTNTVLLNDGLSGQGMPYLIEMGGAIYTFALDDDDYVSLARIDPSANTLTIVTNFAEFGAAFPGLYNPYGFRTDGQFIYFIGNLSQEGTQYWMSDGTAEGTRKIHHFTPTVQNGGPNAAGANMIVFQDQFVYAANDPGVGVELFTGTGVVGISETEAAIDVEAWASGHGLLDLRVQDDHLRHVRILDLSGRAVLEQGVALNGRATLHHRLAMGVYTLHVTTSKGRTARKVLLY